MRTGHVAGPFHCIPLTCENKQNYISFSEYLEANANRKKPKAKRSDSPEIDAVVKLASTLDAISVNHHTKRNGEFSNDEDISASGTWDSSPSKSNAGVLRNFDKPKLSYISNQAEDNIKMFFSSNPLEKGQMVSESKSRLESDASGSEDTSSNIDAMEEELQSHLAESTSALERVTEKNNNKGNKSALMESVIARNARSLKTTKEDFIEFVRYLKDDPSSDTFFTASESHISGDRKSTEMQIINNGHSSGSNGIFSLKYFMF